MFKIFKSLFAIIAVGAIAISSTGAYFTKEVTLPSAAAITAGSISINIGANDQNEVPFKMDNWMPGQTQEVVFNVNNTSTVPVTLSGLVNGKWDNGLDEYVSVTEAEYWDGTAWQKLATTGHGTFTYANRNDASGVLLAVPANDHVSLRMTALFSTDATDLYQGRTYSADLVVTASQVK